MEQDNLDNLDNLDDLNDLRLQAETSVSACAQPDLSGWSRHHLRDMKYLEMFHDGLMVINNDKIMIKSWSNHDQ